MATSREWSPPQPPVLAPPHDGDELRRVFARFPTGVTAVCALVDGEPVGMTANSFTAVSLDPPLVSVCVRAESATWRQLRRARRLGVNVLSEEHEAEGRRLAGPEHERFAGVTWTCHDGGAIAIDGASALMSCSQQAEVTAGDHIVVILEVRGAASWPDVPPLVFHDRGFRRLAP